MATEEHRSGRARLAWRTAGAVLAGALVSGALLFPAVTVAAPDADGDNVSDADETALGTNPNKKDSDGDTVEDGVEINALGSNPLDDDTDSDGLLDGAEVAKKTGINQPDSDGDGVSDYNEVQLNTDPLNKPAAAQPPTNAVSMNISKAGLQVKVNISSKADIPGQCTYNANEVNGLGAPANRDFGIGPKGSTQLSFPAPLLAQTYHVVVSCRGDFNGQNVEFGHVEQDVSGLPG